MCFSLHCLTGFYRLFYDCFTSVVPFKHLLTTSLHSNFNTREIDSLEVIQFFVITSRGVGVTSWKFDRMVLLSLLYLPIPMKGRFISNRP